MAFPGFPRQPLLVLTVLVVAVAIAISAIRLPQGFMSSWRTRPFSSLVPSSYRTPEGSVTQPPTMAAKAPVYFFSHGGPTVMYETEHPAYRVLQNIGQEITQKVKPKAVVVFSGHWEGTNTTVHVNTAEKTDLIYDFYGFPPVYYKAQYPNRGSPELASEIMRVLKQAGIKTEGVTRGLDHGVWSGFHVAFHPEHNPLNVPLVQVSLYKNEDPDLHYRLGQAVSALRDQNIVIIGAGMSVHNLRDYFRSQGSPQPMPYTVSFDEALKDAVEAKPSDRQFQMSQVVKRPDARQAHPYMDHLMPVHVAAGAAGDDAGKRTWTLHEASMGWAQYRFGKVPSS